MDDRFDALVTRLGQHAQRRAAVRGLGALALGSLGLFASGAAADAKTCKERCKDHCKKQQGRRRKARRCRKRCQKRCD